MDFNKLDKKMRKFEESLDVCILNDLYLIVRIDGRCFTKLTKEKMKFEAPFDVKFRDCMVDTVKHLMQCGFNVTYGFTESDEISLLFHPTEASFSRKTRKLNSILAGEASAAFTKALGEIGVFDCRVIPLPNKDLVVDYFMWRQEDANRNALNSHCYWALRKAGDNETTATKKLEGKSVGYKNELLFNMGINYNDLPLWQKRGIGIYFKDYEKEGYNPLTNETTKVTRRGLYVDYELPINKEYSIFLNQFIFDIEK